MKGMDGIATTIAAMRDRDIYSRILIFTVSDDQADVNLKPSNVMPMAISSRYRTLVHFVKNRP